ncbi:MAG: DsbE family thiol:disulfide interchange protein [Acidimicrobiia bacterium]|nr:MAG: DsbE family thiol:disulfide interchange protein [Acidimicrobiia bacterium]
MTTEPETTRTNETEQKRGRKMAWVAIGAAVAFIALGIMFAGRFGGDPSLSSSPLIGKPAPTSPIALQDGTGEVSVADYLGDILVVNFWASWCLSCREEHPAFIQAAADYKDFGVTFMAVNYQDTPGRAAAFLDELGWSPETVYVVDEGSTTAFQWGIIGVPETFFVDRSGIVVGKVSGPSSYGLLSQTIDQIILGQVIGDVKTGEVQNR